MKDMTAATAPAQASQAVRMARPGQALRYPGKNLAVEAVVLPASLAEAEAEAEREAEVGRFPVA